ncbi:MAG: hypothetical protein V1930_02925 [Pseudomonadota bacterium]
MAHHDRVIPPGGKGTVTLKIDTEKMDGDFEKKALVWSNDRENVAVAIYLKGEVKPAISMEPGGYIPLQGVKGKVPPGEIQILNNLPGPVKITSVESNLPDRIRWHLEEIKPGYVYRLKVEDISEQLGDYTGHLTVRTDNPKKPILTIIINGQVEGDT